MSSIAISEPNELVKETVGKCIKEIRFKSKEERESYGFARGMSRRAVPAGNYMFKFNNRNTRTRCEICSKLTIKTQERLLQC